jgi:hypothetical protein
MRFVYNRLFLEAVSNADFQLYRTPFLQTISSMIDVKCLAPSANNYLLMNTHITESNIYNIDVQGEIRTIHFRNVSLELYSYANLLDSQLDGKNS